MKSFAHCRSQISSCVVAAVLLDSTAQAASLGGTVTSNAAGVQSAVVSVYELATKRKSVSMTNGSGAYLFNNLPSGDYVVLIEKDGRRIYQGKVKVPEQAMRFDVPL